MKPGIYDLSEDSYQSDPCDAPSLTQSITKILLAQTPLHAWTAHPKLNTDFVREEREMFDLGTAAHALMLQGLSVAHIIQAKKMEGAGKNRVATDIPVDDYKTKEAREERDAAREAGKVPLLAHQWSRVQRMVLAGQSQLKTHKEAPDAFTDGKPEQSLVWEDDHGVICRARLDWLHASMKKIDDYKSTGMNANPENFGRVVESAGWDVQAAFYRRGVRKLTGQDPAFRFVVQENSEPFALVVLGIGPDFQWSGESKVQRAIDLWAKCLAENKWPGWTDRIAYPLLPVWAESKEEIKQEEGVAL